MHMPGLLRENECMARTRARTRNIDLLIIGDQGVMRALLRDFLQSNFPNIAIGEAGDGSRALTLARLSRPRVMILVDLRPRDGRGVEFISQVKSLLADTRPILITNQQGAAYYEHAHAAGAFAAVNRQKIFTELLPIVARALNSHPTQPEGGAQ